MSTKKANVRDFDLPFDIGDVRKELAEKSVMATYEWRIKMGHLTVTLEKKMPWWLFRMNRKYIKISFSLVVTSASGLLVEYPKFVLFIKKERVRETIDMVRMICQSNSGALRYIEHPNERIRHMAYVKQTDFRDIPIAFSCVNGHTGEVIHGVGSARQPQSIGVPAFMR